MSVFRRFSITIYTCIFRKQSIAKNSNVSVNEPYFYKLGQSEHCVATSRLRTGPNLWSNIGNGWKRVTGSRTGTLIGSTRDRDIKRIYLMTSGEWNYLISAISHLFYYSTYWVQQPDLEISRKQNPCGKVLRLLSRYKQRNLAIHTSRFRHSFTSATVRSWSNS